MTHDQTIITARHKEWGLKGEGSSLEEIARNMGAESKDLEILKTETATERVLSAVPPEFRAGLSYMAYESGHAYGESEIFLHLRELVDGLEPMIEAFEKRIRASLAAQSPEAPVPD